MIGLVLATHGQIGTELLATTMDMVGESVDAIAAVSFESNMSREVAWERLTACVDSVDRDNGVLVMVDMFGGTPSHLAMALLAERKVEVVTGTNLAMVLRAVLRRADRTLEELAEDVLAYGRRNVSASAKWLTPHPSSDESGT